MVVSLFSGWFSQTGWFETSSKPHFLRSSPLARARGGHDPCRRVTVYLHACDTVSAAWAGIGKYFAFYNAQRPHAALDRKPPDHVYFNRLTSASRPATDGGDNAETTCQDRAGFPVAADIGRGARYQRCRFRAGTRAREPEAEATLQQDDEPEAAPAPAAADDSDDADDATTARCRRR